LAQYNPHESDGWRIGWVSAAKIVTTALSLY